MIQIIKSHFQTAYKRKHTGGKEAQILLLKVDKLLNSHK
jgi:hypothetical protein